MCAHPGQPSSVLTNRYACFGGTYGLDTLVPKTKKFDLGLRPRRGNPGFYELDIPEGRRISVLHKGPLLDEALDRTTSLHHVGAEEMSVSGPLYAASFRFHMAHSWQGVGIIALHQIGWRPDCASSSPISVDAVLPPVKGGQPNPFRRGRIGHTASRSR